MKVLIFLLSVLLTSPCFAFTSATKAVVGASSATAALCSGTTVFVWYCENSATVGDGADNGNGCVISGGDTSIAVTTATYSTDYTPPQGSYSIVAEAENGHADISSTNIDLSVTGTWCASAYLTGSASGEAFLVGTGGPSGSVTWQSAQSNYSLTLSYGTNNTGSSSTDRVSTSSWTRICYSWDLSPADGSRKLATKVGANAWQEKGSITQTPIANPATYFILTGEWQYGRGHYDDIRMYTDYQHAE